MLFTAFWEHLGLKEYINASIDRTRQITNFPDERRRGRLRWPSSYGKGYQLWAKPSLVIIRYNHIFSSLDSSNTDSPTPFSSLRGMLLAITEEITKVRSIFVNTISTGEDCARGSSIRC